MRSSGLWNCATALGLIVMMTVGCRTPQEAVAGSGSLTGILFVTGNEPFTDISLQAVNGRMHVIRRDTSALYSALRGLQGKKVRLQFRLPDAKSDSTLIIVQHYDLVTER
jgi:hypothetical protein